MTKHTSNWSGTNFDDSRREQLRQAQAMSVRQRLEALDQLAQLSERMQAMPKCYPAGVEAGAAATANHEPGGKYGATSTCNEIVLGGCTPTPLASYLKALGVLRLVSTPDPQAKAAWRGEAFVLQTTLDRTGLEDFFLHEYQPTPILAPWNGGSGFYFQERKSAEKDPETGKRKKLGVRDQPTAATKTVESVLTSSSPRLRDYRSALSLGKQAVKQFGLEKAPENGKPKDDLVQFLRGSLPERCLEWLDAALVTKPLPQSLLT